MKVVEIGVAIEANAGMPVDGPGGGRPFEGPPEIELEKLISDSLYLDNQAHAVVVRMRDMDSGTKSQLRRLYNAVRRAVRGAGKRAPASVRYASRAPGLYYRAALPAEPGCV